MILACCAFFSTKNLAFLLIILGCIWFEVSYSVYQFIGGEIDSNSNREIMLFIGKPKGRSRMISNELQYSMFTTTQCVPNSNKEHIELPTKLLNYFLQSNGSNINQKCQITNPLSNQTSWDTNRTKSFQFQNSLSETMYVNTWNITITNTRLVSILLRFHTFSSKTFGTIMVLSRGSTFSCWSQSRIWVLPPVHDDHPLLRHIICL